MKGGNMLYHEWLLNRDRQIPLFPHHCENCGVGIGDGAGIEQTICLPQRQKIVFHYCGPACQEAYGLYRIRQEGI